MKYIIVDLDDTLLKKDKSVSDYTIDIFNRIRDLGFIMVFNTARSYKSCSPYIDLLKPDYAILNGGVEICDKDKNIIYKNLVDKDLSNTLLNIIKEDPDVTCYSIQSESDLYSNDLEFIKKNKLALYYSFSEDINEGCYKIMASASDFTKWKELAKRYNLEFESYWNHTWFRFTKATKRDGNIKLYELLNDNNPISYIFGDDTGDLEMLREATYPVCMKNSHPKVLDEIKNVTKYDNLNDGVAHYLEDLFLR